jgi:hypothetical protein
MMSDQSVQEKEENRMDQQDKKNQEAIVLELDERLEFGAVVVDSGDPTALGLNDTQCLCQPTINFSC